MKKMAVFLLLSRVLGIGNVASAMEAPKLSEPQRQAKAIFLNFEKLRAEKNRSPFQIWFEAMADFTALECMSSNLGVKIGALEAPLVATGLSTAVVKTFLDRKIEAAGAYTSASKREQAQLCPAIATVGFKPFCSPGSIVTDASFKQRHQYPMNYVVLKAGHANLLNLQLRCSVAVLETKSNGGTSFVSWPIQYYQVKPADVMEIESVAFAKWSGASGNLLATAVQIPSGYKSSVPLNLPSGPVTDVMTGNLTLKMKAPEATMTWTVVVEP